MKINIKEVIIVILLSVFCGLIRYFLLDDDFLLIKKSKLSSAESQVDYQYQDSLLLFIENSNSPKLIDIDLAKKLYDSNLVTFIDARDSDSYLEKHRVSEWTIYWLTKDYLEQEPVTLSRNFKVDPKLINLNTARSVDYRTFPFYIGMSPLLHQINSFLKIEQS